MMFPKNVTARARDLHKVPSLSSYLSIQKLAPACPMAPGASGCYRRAIMTSARPGCRGVTVLTGKVEIQVEILNSWRYAKH